MEIKQGVTKIGTGPGSDVVVDDGYMSTDHAMIVMSPEGFWLQDNNSANGTFLNDNKLAKKEELFDNKDHAILAHERATGVKKLVTVPDIKHYGIYYEARDRAQKEAVAWFDEHLKGK